MNINKNRFENLEVWKISMRLCVDIYEQLKDNKDYGFKDQIQRAAVSIPANIAEGMERQTTKETIHFLYIAKGSAGECRTLIYLAIELKYIAKEIGLDFIECLKKVAAMIYSLIELRKKNLNSALVPLNPLTL